MKQSLGLTLVAASLTACSVGEPGPSGSSATGQGANASQAFRGSGLAACPRTKAGSPAPAGVARLPSVELACMDGSGRAVRLDQLRGVPTVVNLWASWCGPCAAELPVFQRLHAANTGKLTVLGVSTQDAPARAVASARDIRLAFPSVSDQTGQGLRALGRRALPVTAFVGADGAVRGVYSGPVLTDAALKQLVARYLQVVVR